MEKSDELNINLNAESYNGQTGFHLACLFSHVSIVEMFLENSESYKLNLETKDNHGKTGYKIAKEQLINLPFSISFSGFTSNSSPQFKIVSLFTKYQKGNKE